MGSIPGWGMHGRQLIDVSLSHLCFCLSLSLPHPLPPLPSFILKSYPQVRIKKTKGLSLALASHQLYGISQMANVLLHF